MFYKYRIVKIIFTFCPLLVFLIFLACAARIEAPPPSEYSPLFQTKCSTCHTLERALIVGKDGVAWRKTILEMQKKEGSEITEDDVEKLVRYHVERQKREREIFEKDCSGCHELDRSVGKLKTHSGWCETIKRMQNKAPGAICDEEIDVLVNYHLREGRMLSDLFLKKCSKCHSPERTLRVYGDWMIWEKTILEMQNKYGSDITASDARKLIKYHVEMQKEEQEIFEKDCILCHPAERSLDKQHTRSEWCEIIRDMQKKAPDIICDEEIDILVNYHIRKSQPALTY